MIAPAARTTSRRSRLASHLRVAFAVSTTALIATGCDAGQLGAPQPRAQLSAASDPERVAVCHKPDAVASIVELSVSALPAHERHGDYVARLEVADDATPGDGIHFRRVTDALAEARAGRIARGELESAACRITIAVAAGVRPGSTTASGDATFERFPFIIDVPDITVRGALRMLVDEKGRATGVSEDGEATTFAPSPALRIIGGTGGMNGAPEPIFIVNAHPDGPKGHGAVIEGFVFQSGRTATDLTVGGFGVFAIRANDLTIRGNKFETGFTSGVDLRASSALVERNHLSGRGSSCDLCLAGPGSYAVRDNRLIFGGTPGVLILPAVFLPVLPLVEQYTLPATSLITAVVTNNEVRDHLRVPVGVGVRIVAVGVEASNVIGTSRVTLTDNELVNNTFGIIIEAGFPRNNTLRRGDLEVTTSGNRITGSCQNDLLVTLTSGQTGIGTAATPVPYLLGSTYTLSLGSDLSWDRTWYAHASGFGNTLTVNGATVENGVRHSYNATRVCTP